MKRDLDLVRMLLLHIETGEAPKGFDQYDEATVSGHAALVIEAGLAKGSVVRDYRGVATGAVLQNLTWEGHDFLDAARDDTLWKKAREKFLKPGASWTFDLLKEWLKLEIKQKLLGGGHDIA